MFVPVPMSVPVSACLCVVVVVVVVIVFVFVVVVVVGAAGCRFYPNRDGSPSEHRRIPKVLTYTDTQYPVIDDHDDITHKDFNQKSSWVCVYHHLSSCRPPCHALDSAGDRAHASRVYPRLLASSHICTCRSAGLPTYLVLWLSSSFPCVPS